MNQAVVALASGNFHSNRLVRTDDNWNIEESKKYVFAIPVPGKIRLRQIESPFKTSA